jgi:hypothetical protein
MRLPTQIWHALHLPLELQNLVGDLWNSCQALAVKSAGQTFRLWTIHFVPLLLFSSNTHMKQNAQKPETKTCGCNAAAVVYRARSASRRVQRL